MKTNFAKYISFLVAFGFLLLIAGCSTKKNTWVSRTHQSINTRFNIFFNGNESFKQGLKRINESHTEDYSELLLMYPISYHENASAGAGDMATAQEKTEKAIKKRSIVKKPKKNPKKSRDPKYQAFYSKEEFNTMIDDSWLLMGKAQFYQTDFLGAVGTFTYIIKHFTYDTDIVSEAQIWLARSYAEMGWLYEAEDVLNKINQDGFSKKQNTFFAAVSADLLLKQKQYNDAVPFLTLAISGESDKRQRGRWEFILGQIYEQRGDRAKAYEMFTAVAKSNPPFEMALNARLRQAENHIGSDKEDLLKNLNKMARDSKNSDYLDQIYAAIGNIYIQQRDTTKAIENYILSIEKSTRQGYEKAQSLIMLADLYYAMDEYLEAQPYYNEAVSLMNAQSSDFRRVVNLAEVLSELNMNVEIITLQDSLQTLSKLPEKEQLAEINKIIERVKKEEEEAKKKAEEERLLAESMFGAGAANMGNTNTNMLMSLGEGRNTSFYFYNPQLIAAGKADFVRKWGNRKLEDNWRRQVKSALALDPFADEDRDFEDEENAENAENTAPDDPSMDNKKPEYYLKQLFTTDEQFETSDMEIMEALYSMGFIYTDRINNTQKAIETFEELERRFPNFDKIPDVYFYLYQTYNSRNEKDKADIYRQKLIAQYPDNKYSRILSQPDYEDRLRRMAAEQDSLYEKTYYNYLTSNFQEVFNSYNYMEKNFPASYLMPKFALLNALSTAKTNTPENFKVSLEQLVEKYPESDVTSIAKDMLALMAQGQESKTGESHGNLITLREQETAQNTQDENISFEKDENVIYFFVLALPKDKEIDINKLQFQVADYNFTKFLIKDFDIEIRKYDEETLLIVRNFESLDEALWYKSGIEQDNTLANEINTNGITAFVVSQNNLRLVYSNFTLEEYFDFFNKNIAKNPNQKIVIK